MIKNVVEYLVKNLVETPDVVSVIVNETDQKISITVMVAPDDLKRVIGREGRVVFTIQSLVAAFNPDRGVNVVINAVQ
jgi:uncharacterized protein